MKILKIFIKNDLSMKSKIRLPLKLIVLILIAFLFTYCSKKKENEIAHLQSEFIFSDSDTHRSRIIDQLEKYILELPVADSIVSGLKSETGKIINAGESNNNQSLDNYRDESNLYHLEEKFYNVLKSKITARANQADVKFNGTDSIAEYLDSGFKIHYWSLFLNQVKKYSPETAQNWISADLASHICRQYMDNLNHIKTGLQYAALCLRNLQKCPDERIKCDIVQQIQYALYKYYGYNDLSIALGERYLVSCQAIGYQLRAYSIRYHIASAYYESGKLDISLSQFRSLLSSLEQNNQVPYRDWFITNSMLCLTETYIWAGDYTRASSICDSVEKKDLSKREKVNVLITRGLISRNLGKYEQAEKSYQMALKIAEATDDFENIVNLYNNLGYMFLKLSEYQQALKYFKYALEELETNTPESRDQKINVLINIADVYAGMKDFKKIVPVIDEAKTNLSQLGDIPIREADLLNSLGKFQMDIGQYTEAYPNLKKAESICDENSLVKIGLRVKLNLADNLMQQKEYKDAETKISGVLNIAEKIKDTERQIDAFAAMGRLKSIQGDRELASHYSDLLIERVNKLSEGFEDSQHLIAYQQKINDYLKAAVEYDISLNRLDSAIIKLDFAKSMVFLQNFNRSKPDNILSVPDIKKVSNNLKPGEQIVDYMLTKNLLYIFIVNNSGISLEKIPCNYDSLRSMVIKYVQSINNTINIFKNYSPQDVDEHFKMTTILSRKLYEILIGNIFNNENADSNSILYIIPDDYLHYIPFATLVTDDSNDPKFLIEKTNIAYLPGLNIKNIFSGSDNNSGNDKILLASDPSMVSMNSFIDFMMKSETHAQIFNSRSLMPSKRELLAQFEDKFNMYIFAGHSFANSRDPGSSYIEITTSSGKYKLNMQDILNMDWYSAKLIFLLGCETAGGSLYRGMGISGLQSSFLLSGARNVLASLWRIDAAQSIQQATDFLTYLKRTNSFIKSLRKTQLDAINRLRSDKYFRHAHPYFWGSYILSQKYYL